MDPDDDEWVYGVEDVNQIYPNIYHSAFHTAEDKDKLAELGITHILSMGEEFEEKYQDEFKYKICPLTGDEDQDVQQYFKDGIQFIEEALEDGGTVLLH